MARIRAMTDKQLQRQLKSMVIMQAAQNDPRRAMTWIDPKDENEQHLVSSIFHSWARKDEKAAMAAMASLTGRASEMARMALLSVMAEKDPLAAWQAASQLPATSGNTQDPRIAVIQSWSQRDAPAAAAASLELENKDARNSALGIAMRAWADADFNAALGFATGLEDPLAKSDALVSLARGQVKDRDQLFEAVLEHVPPGDAFQQAVGSLFSSWANEDPSAAAEAALQLHLAACFPTPPLKLPRLGRPKVATGRSHSAGHSACRRVNPGAIVSPTSCETGPARIPPQQPQQLPGCRAMSDVPLSAKSPRHGARPTRSKRWSGPGGLPMTTSVAKCLAASWANGRNATPSWRLIKS